jgi:hypothetical protein
MTLHDLASLGGGLGGGFGSSGQLRGDTPPLDATALAGQVNLSPFGLGGLPQGERRAAGRGGRGPRLPVDAGGGGRGPP